MSKKAKRTASMISVVTLGSLGIAGGLAATADATTVGGSANAGATTIYPGTTTAVATETFTVTNVFNAADTIALDVGTAAGGQNTGGATNFVEWAAAPTITVSANTPLETTHGDTAPAFSHTLTTDTADSAALRNAAITDQLNLAFTNSATGTAGDSYTVTLSGIQYTTGSTNAPAGVFLESTATTSGTAVASVLVSNATVAATIGASYTEAPTGIFGAVANQPVANVVITEAVAGTITGAVAITPAHGTFSGTPVVTATGATGDVIGPVTIVSGAVNFSVTTPSTTAATYTVSGLVYTANVLHPTDTVAVTYGATTMAAPSQIPITAVGTTRTGGATADNTAAQETARTGVSENNTVILVSDAGYQDALSASYLSGFIGAPILLNPPTVPAAGEASTAAAAEITALDTANPGVVTTVDIVGGPDALSPAVATALSAMHDGLTNNNGTAEDLTVNRIYGITAEDTAQQVAQSGGFAATPLTATPGAYGMYNNGYTESASDTTIGAQNTAILASGDEFQDALAAAPLAVKEKLPVLLTTGATLSPQVSAAIQNLGIQQVIVVGGPAVVSDADVTALEADGVSVLRIAGATFSATAVELASFELSDYSPTSATVPAVPGTVDGLDIPFYGWVATSRGDGPYDAMTASLLLSSDSAVHAGAFLPLLLTTNTGSAGSGTLGFLGTIGTGATGGFPIYGSAGTVLAPTSIESAVGIQILGGTLAQPGSVVQAEISAIAAG